MRACVFAVFAWCVCLHFRHMCALCSPLALSLSLSGTVQQTKHHKCTKAFAAVRKNTRTARTPAHNIDDADNIRHDSISASAHIYTPSCNSEIMKLSKDLSLNARQRAVDTYSLWHTCGADLMCVCVCCRVCGFVRMSALRFRKRCFQPRRSGIYQKISDPIASGYRD